MNQPIIFPPVEECGPEGILALGGNLTVDTLINAYTQGIFPWPISTEIPLAWFAPDPRGVIFVENLHIPKKVARILRKRKYEVRFNTCFEDVIIECAKTSNRPGQTETWITPSIIRSYINLHKMGYAYSVETFENDKLVGGLYGVNIGQLASGESMFYQKDDASKVALISLITELKRLAIPFLDTQMITPVVEALGGTEIPREEFMTNLSKLKTLGHKGLISSL